MRKGAVTAPRSCGGGSTRGPRASPSSRRMVPAWLLALDLGSPFGLKVGHLAGHHARWAGRLGQNRNARKRRRLGPDLARQHLERQRQEPIPGQDRRRLVKRPVAGRPATPQVVVVHRRQIVVNQRIRVHHLQRTAAGNAASPVAATRLGRHQAQERAAAACHPPAHCNASPSPAAPDTRHPGPANFRQVAAQGLLDAVQRLAQIVAQR